MADAAYAPSPAEKREGRAEAEKSQPKGDSAKFWLEEIGAAGKRDDDWIKRGREVVQRYRDERGQGGAEKRANILWSNTELLKSALFQRLGNPDVRRRFPKRGADEKNTKQAALVMERGASYSNEAYDCESQIEACVEDMVLPGRGVAWVVYDAVVEPNEETGEDEIVSQTVKDEHVYWEDYRTSSGREEKDVWWKARCHYYSRDDLVKFFPDYGSKVPLNSQLADTTKDAKKDEDDTFKRARVWEIWDKTKRQRVYVAEDYNTILKTDDDPYRLKDFFPCPEPLYGVKTTSSLTPVPEFCLYQDQANELDTISTRLYYLIDALKRRGVYDAGAEGTDMQLSALATAGDNTFLPFRGFAGLMEKGGLKGVFQTEDLAPLIAAIEGLYKRAAFLVQTIYEVTGISDVMRGANSQDQTATEVRVKGQFGSMRLTKRQKRIQRFVRDLVRIKTEIIAEHFTRETLQEMAGIDMPLAADKQQAMMQLQALQQQMQMAQAAQQQGQQPPGAPPMGHNGGPPMGMSQPPIQPPNPEQIAKLQEFIKQPTWEDVSAILRSDQRRGYKVDVETDQTAQVDELEEKNSRIEFMSTVQALVEKAIPMAMQLPAMRPLIKESVMFVVKAFKAGRPMEEAFEDAFDQLSKMPPPQGGGDPVAEAKAQQIQTETKLSMQEAQANAQAMQIEQQTKQQAAQADMALKGIDLQGKRQELAQKQADAQADRAIKMREAQLNFGKKVEETEMERAMAESNRDLGEVNNRLDLEERIRSMRSQADSDLADITHKDEAHRADMASRKHKMALAERKANQPQAGA